MKRVYLLGGVLLTAVLCAPVAARADVKCTGTITGGVINGDAVVPPNQNCIMTGTKINGNIKVMPGASLMAQGVTINGDVEATHATFVEIQNNSLVTGDINSNFSTLIGLRYGCTLKGDFNVKNGTGPDSGRWGIDSSTVMGDVESVNSDGTSGIYNCQIGGNVHVYRHSGRLVLWVSCVNGTVTIEDSVMIALPPNPGYIGVYMSTIRGSVIYMNNTGAFPILCNVINGNLVCSHSDPGTSISQNTVSGQTIMN